MWKTVGMRIRSTKQELEEAGEDTDGMVESTAKLRELVKGLTGFDIMADKAGTQFKDIYDIVVGIGEQWNKLNDTEQAGLLETLAGKNQGNALAAAFNNVEKIKEIYNTAEYESDGSAQRENEKYLDSINGKLNILESSFQSLSTTVVNSDFIKATIDGLTILIDTIDSLINNLGLLGTIGVGAGITGFFKNLDSFKNLGNIFNSFDGSFKSLKDFTSLLDSLGGKSLSNIDKISSALKILSDAGESAKGISSIQTLSTIMKTFDGSDTAINSVVSAISGLSSESQIAVLSMFNLSEAQAKAILTSVGLKGEMLETAVATVTSGTAAKGASIGFTAFATSVKAAATGLATFLLTNPVGWCILAAGAIFGVVKAIDFFTESFEEAKEKAEDSRNAYEDTASEVESLNSKLETTRSRIDELKTQGKLSITEQEELSNLEAQNEQLSRQLAIKEKLATYQQGKAAEDAENVLTKKSTYSTGRTVESMDDYGNTTYEYEYKNGDIIDQTKDKQELLNEKTKEYNDLLAEQENLDVEYSKWWQADTEWEKSTKKAESLKKEIDNLNGEISDNLSEINNQYGSLFDEDGNIIEGYEDTVNRANEVIDQCTASTNELEDAQNGVSESSKEVSVSIESLSDNVNNLSEYQKNLSSALESSKSATGLTTEEITNLTNAYSELDSFDANRLFENTANGVHLNKEELARLNEELESSKLEEFGSKIKSLEQDLAEAMINGEDTSGIEAEIEQVKQLQSQYEGLCSSYNKWLTAKSGGNERDSYEAIGNSYKDMKEILDQGWYGDESLNAYLDLLLSASERTGDAQKDFEKLNKTISGTGHSLMDYWQFDSNNNLVTDGLFDFLDDVNKKFGDAYASIDENGKYAFDFTGDRLQEVADEFGTTTEMVQLFERAMVDAGMAVNLGDTESVDTLQEKLDSVNSKLKEIGKEPVDVDINVNKDNIDSEISNAKKLVSSLVESDGTLKVGVEQSDYNNALSILTSLISKKSELQNPALMSVQVDTSDSASEIEQAIGLLQQLKDASNLYLETDIGADTTEAQTKIQDILTKINNDIPDEVKTTLGLDDESFQTALTTLKETEVDVEAGVNLSSDSVNKINDALTNITPEMMVEAGLDREKVDEFLSENHDTKSKIEYDVDDKKVKEFKNQDHDVDADINYKAVFNEVTPPTIYGGVAYYTRKYTGDFADGTAHVQGTAFAKGNWGTKDSGIALGGEVGQELIVRNGHFFTIGDNGAEFFQYKKDDIIFNAGQTSQIFKYGKIKNGKKRGEVFAQGTAFVEGTAFDIGTGGGRRINGGSTHSASSPKKKSSSSSNKKSSSKSKSSSSAEEAEESFDWIEVTLNRIQEAFDRLKLIADNVYKSFTTRNNALNKELKTVTKEISAQQKAYNAYMKEANSVGLSSAWKKKVQSGSYSISEIKDEGLSKKISDYKTWYEKAVACKDAIAELKKTESELYAQRMELTQSKYNSKNDYYDTLIGNLESRISYNESRGYGYATKDYYKKASSYTNAKTNNLINERNNLQSQLNKSVKNGAIKKYSEAWYEWQNEINSLNGEIYSCAEQLQNYAEKIANLPFDKLDIKLEKINSTMDVLDAKYEATQSATNKNKIIKDQNKQAKKELNAYNTAYSEAKSYTNSLWNSSALKSARKTSANKGKSKGDTLSTSGLKVGSKEYQAVLKYNEALKAQQEAYNDAKKASYEYTNTLRENAKKMFDNIQSEYESKQTPTNALISYYNTKLSYRDSMGYSQTSQYQKDVYNKLISNNKSLLASQEKELADLQKNYNKNKSTMSAADAREAKAEIYALQESILETKASIADLQSELNNIEVKKLEISLDKLQTKANELEDAISLKEAKGISIDETDYVALIKNSQKQIDNLKKQNELLKEQQSQYSVNSEKYEELREQIEANEDAIREAEKSQIEWNNAIADIPISKLEKALELVEAISDYEESLLDLKIASGEVITESDYKNQIKSQNEKLNQLQEERDLIYDYYQKALASEDGTYGGKTADEWKKEYIELDTEINQTKIDIIELQDELDNLSVKKLQNELNELEHTASKLQNELDIKETKGIKATESDYQSLINNSKQQQTNLEQQNRLLEYQLLEVEKGSDKYYEIKNQINENNEAIAQCKKEQAEWNVELENLPLERLEEALDLLDAIDEKTKSEIDLKVAQGKDLTEADYQKQISDNNNQISNLQQQKSEATSNYYKALASEDGTYGGKTANEWEAEINKVETSINDLKIENEELKDSLRDDVYWRQFERMHDEVERTSDTLNGMSNLIDDDMLFDNDGNLTQYGVDKMALLIKQYELARKEVQNYQNDIDNLNKLYREGQYTQEEYNEKLAELQSGMLDAANDMKDYQDSIVDMQKKMAQYELDSLFELIDARNKALQAKKEYYDFDKTIRSKTKDIKELQRQISALEGVDTAEARAKRAKLQAELQEKQEDLDDTINEHIFEMSQDSLDGIKDALQEAFDDKWDDIVSNMSEIQKLMNYSNEIVSSSANQVNSSLNEILRYYGVNSNSGINANNIVSNNSSSNSTIDKNSSNIPTSNNTVSNNSNQNISDMLKDALSSALGVKGKDFFVRQSDGAVLIPLDYEESIIPENFISSLKDWTNCTPETIANALISELPNDLPINDVMNNIQYNFENLLTVQGNVDSTVITDLKKFASQFYKGAYDYTIKEIAKDARKNGVKV